MARLIIEEINRLGHCTERHRFDHLPVRIGRGYDNELILSDPHVSPEHVIIHETEDDETGWRIEDCNSENGTQIKHHSTNTTPGRASSGDDIVIGRCRLRLFSPSHPVGSTHSMPNSESAEKLIAQPFAVFGIFTLTFVALLINKQLQIPTMLPVEKLIASVLPVLIAVFFWASAWSFAGRLIKHKTSFLIHLSITSLFTLCLIGINILGEYIAFNSSTSTFAQIVEFIVMGLSLYILFSVNIENATAISRKTRRITSHGLTWGFLVFAVFMDYASKPEFTHSPSFVSILKPPYAQLVSSETPSDFLKQSTHIFEFDDED